MNKSILGIVILSGAIIGVGFFSLPYITLQSGFLVVLAYFLFFSPIIILIHQLYGELAIATPDYKRLPGFAQIYLGKWGKNLALFSTIFGLLGSLLAYLIVGGEFLENLLSPMLGGSNFLYTLLYFLIGAIVIYLGVKIISKIELFGVIGFFLILILIFFQAKNVININNLFLDSGNINLFKKLFLPYGPILFSLWGASVIPEVEEMLGEKKFLLKKIIPISILITIFIYLFFICLVLGITGFQTTESALTGLQYVLNNKIASLGFIFGILTTFTSFIALGLTLKKIFWYDLKLNKNLAFLITCFLPLTLFLVGIKKFIPVISIVGGIAFSIDGILILLMYKKQNKIKKSKIKNLLIYPLILIFFGGIIYELIYFIK